MKKYSKILKLLFSSVPSFLTFNFLLLTCLNAAVSFSSSTIDATGAGYFTQIVVDKDGGRHAIYATSLDSVRYSSAPANGSWGPFTTVFDGACTTWISVAIDTTTVPNKLHLSAYNSTLGDVVYSSATIGASSIIWSSSTVNSTNDVGGYSSIAIDSLGNPHIAYRDKTIGVLKYSSYSVTNGWQSYTVDDTPGTDSGLFTSIKIGQDGLRHIVYGSYGADYDLKIATKAAVGWSTSTIVSAGSVGTYCSLAIEPNGDLHVSCKDETGGYLKYIKRLSGVWQSEIIVDNFIGNGNLWNTIGIGANNSVHIAYYDTINTDLKHAQYEGSWSTQTVWGSGSNVGEYASLYLQNFVSSATVNIACYNSTLGDAIAFKGEYPPSDTTAPAGISNLTALKGANNGEIVLNWTSPGDDGTVGNLTGQFEIEYTTGGIITNANYYSPPPQMFAFTISTTNLAPLTACTTTIYNLIPGATYYFAIKSKDDANNISVWNSSDDVVSVNTAAFVNIPSVVKSVIGGGWDSPNTWEYGSVPWPSQGVQIQSGHIITSYRNDTNVTCSTITIFGTLQFDGAVANRSMLVAGNVDIQSGGQFLMPPNTGYISALKIKCDTDGQYGIIVNDGGKFDVQGTTTTTPSTRNCLIASDNPSYKTYIRNLSQTETNFNMYYVEVSSVGANAVGKYGITFDGAGTRGKINYCSIHNGFAGIYLYQTSNNTITNNSCYNFEYGIYLNYSSSNTLSNNNSFSNYYDGIYLYNGCNNTLNNNNCSSNSDNGIDLYSSNNTLSNNNCYSNTNYGIYLYNSSNNILSSNNCYFNLYGIFILISYNNILNNNNCYSNTSHGIHTRSSSNNTAVNCELGKSGNNSSGDIGYYGGVVSKLTLKSCNLYSTTKVNTTGMDTAGSYLVSYNQDGTQGTTKIWGDYSIPSGSTGTFNYVEPLYVSTATLPNSTLKGTGSITYPTTNDNLTLTELWEVKYNGSSFDVRRGTWSVLTFDGTATVGSAYTSATRGVGFTANGTFQLDDAFYFVTVSSSVDMNVQKKLEFNDTPIGTRMFVENGGSVQMLGTQTNPTVSTNAVGSTYYGFQSSGSINLSNYTFSNLKSSGLEIYQQATVVDLSSGTFNTIQGSVDSSYIRVNGITSNKTFYGCAFNDTTGTANYNIKADGAGINWTFLNWSGVKAGESYDYEINGAQIKWDITPPTVTDLQVGDDVVRVAAGTTYNVDFFDDGSGLDTVQYSVWTLPAQTGTNVKPWTNIAVLGGATYYQTDWQVAFNSLLSLPTTNWVSVRAWDVAGNTQTINDVFYVMKDTVPPISVVTYPISEQNLTLLTISGTANDNYGLNKVEIKIKRLSDEQYWTGSNWGASETWLLTSGVNPWQYYGLNDYSYLTVGTSYWVVSRASDTVGNVETPGAGNTFTYKLKKTIASGNWTSTATWFGGQIPLDGDEVIIKTGHSVNLLNNTSNLYSLNIESGGNLDWPSSYMVNITSQNGGGFYNYGSLSNVLGTCYFDEQKVILSTSSQQLGSSVFFNLGSTVTLQSDVTFGYVGLNSGGKLDPGSWQIKVNGNWQQDGTFVAGNSTVTFTGTNNQNIDGTGTSVELANFTVNSSSTVTPLKSLGVDNFTIISGTFVAGNYEHAVAGNFTQTGGGFEANTSTITFDGTGAQTVSVLPGTLFKHFQYSGTGSLTPQSNLDISGNFTEGAGTFNCGNYTYNIGGNITNNTGWTLGGNSTFIFDGTSPQTMLNGINFDNVIVKNPTKVVYAADTLSQLKNLSIDPGCSFDSSALGYLEIFGNFTSSGIYVNGGSTTTFSQSGNSTIWTVANSTFNNVIVQKNTVSDVVTSQTGLNIGGALKVNSGTLNMGSTSHIIQGDTIVDGANALLDIGSSTTTLVGNVQVINGGTLLLPNANPPSILKLGYPSITINTGGFFVSQSSNNVITSTAPGSSFYIFQCQVSTVNITGLTVESAGNFFEGLHLDGNAQIVNLNNIHYKTLKSGSKALCLLYSTIPGTFTFTGHDFDASVSTNIGAFNLIGGGLVVMQNATGAKAGASYEDDPNDRVFWVGTDAITVNYPAGGETFVVGASTSIKWTTSGSIKNVKLEYSKDDFASANFIANVSTSASFGSYNWVIPNDSSTTIKLRVSAVNYPTINTISNIFTIQPPVAAPSGLTTALLGTTSIQWKFTDNALNETDLYISSGPDVTMRLSENLGLLSGNGGTTSWWEINLSTNTQYTRYAESRNAVGSSWSAMISSYTASAMPTGTKIIARSSYSVELDWQPNGNPEPGTDYIVSHSTLSDFSSEINGTASTSTYIVSSLDSATIYYFKVRSRNGDLVINQHYDYQLTTTTLDGLPPTVSITEPANGSYKNYASIFSAYYGPVSDNVAVSSAVISMRISGGNYTSGPAFDSVAPVWFDCNIHPSSWTYQPTPSDILTSGTMYVIEVKAVDPSGNWSSVATSSCTYDNTMPVSEVVLPANGSIINSLATISGTASDNIGVQSVEVQIQRLSDGSYWTGAGWSVEIWLPATGTSAWNYTGLTTADLTSGTSYQIVSHVTDFAVNTSTLIIGSVIFTYQAPVVPPSAPTLTATEVTNLSIKWVWTDVANEQGYYVYTSTGGFLTSVSADTVNYTETGFLPNTQYSRYVEAYNVSGTSTSAVISKYTIAALPTSFVCSSKDYNWLALSWSANGNPAGTIYELYRSTSNLASDFLLLASSISLSYTDAGLSQLTTYYYRIYSVNAESVKTGPAELTVQTLNSVIKGPVSGKVTQSDGTAILGVLVQLYDNEGTVKLGETTTVSDGTYLFDNLDDGLYQIACSWLVNEIESVVYKTDIPENSKDVLFTLEIQYQLAQLVGKITLGSRANFVSGKFAPAQQPFVELLQRGRVIAKIDADTSGDYAIPNLLPGKYVVRAFNGVQMSEPTEIKVSEGEKVMLNFRWALGLQDSEVYSYPNPWKQGQSLPTIRYKANTNHTATLRIYNIAGELVREIKGDGSEFGVSSVKKIPWDLRNDDDSEVASGVYIYILELKETADDGEKATVKKKIAIIK